MGLISSLLDIYSAQQLLFGILLNLSFSFDECTMCQFMVPCNAFLDIYKGNHLYFPVVTELIFRGKLSYCFFFFCKAV